MALSLDELDKSSHCPENVDEDSWKKLCEVRRKKIESEEKIQALDNEIYETDQSVCERGALSVQVAKDLEVRPNLHQYILRGGLDLSIQLI